MENTLIEYINRLLIELIKGQLDTGKAKETVWKNSSETSEGS